MMVELISPFTFTRSPMLHGYWLRTLGIPGSYDMFDVPPAELDTFFASLREALGPQEQLDVTAGATLGDVARALDVASKLGRLATGMATGWPIIVVAVLRPSMLTATRWRNLMLWKSAELAR
mgnify:CR=1 FL=1